MTSTGTTSRSAKPAGSRSTSKAANEGASAPEAAASPVTATPSDKGTALRNKELIDSAVARSGVRKKFARPAIEAAIKILSEAILSGRDLNLPPLGKVKLQRSKDVGGNRISMAKIRQSKGANKRLGG